MTWLAARSRRSRTVPERRSRTVPVLIVAAFAVALGGQWVAREKLPAEADAAEPQVAEVSARWSAGGGRSLRLTLLVDTTLADPAAAIAEAAPPGATESGATAAFVEWVVWPEEALPIVLQYNGEGAPEGIDGLAALTEATGKWNAASDHSFRFEVGEPTTVAPPSCRSDPDPDGVMVVGWASNLSIGTLASTCALIDDSTGDLVEMDVTFSPAAKWSTADQTPADSFDLKSTMLHEMGHVLGLEHTSIDDAVMLAVLSRGQQRRSLTQDDIDGVGALYPADEPPPVLTITVNGIAVAKD